jgi:predicted metal-dependent hydrolase|tara:strand:+ start:229 stop:609 length:381 start_codon:yes stop_codon:yes gene_type:complete
MNPFEFSNSITYTKQDIMNDLNEKEYAPFLVNRALSYHQDCILYANEMNRRFDISHKLQYHYLLNTIRKRKRFAKWSKPQLIDDLKIVMDYYSVSRGKAEEYLSILNKSGIETLKKRMNKGGKSEL